MDITGKLPRTIVDNLSKLNVIVDDIMIAGDDIDVIFTKNGTQTSLYAVYVGNNRWVIEELEDAANLFPSMEEGDALSADAISKTFTSAITSGLILSFNPLGKIKYGIRDVGKAVGRAAKKVGKGIADWAADRLDADQAENFIRKNGPYRRKYFDTRDDKVKEKKDYSAKNINVGKIEKMGKMGHWKVLTGNPDTQDFQVWHLYRNGMKTRVLDLRTNLQAQEAQWAFDNNIPKSWTTADWQGADGEQQKANEIPLNQVGEEQAQEEEDNVTEGQVEESQTTEEQDDDVHEFVKKYYNEDEDEDIDAAITNSVNNEEDNVIESSEFWTETVDEPFDDRCEVIDEIEEDNVTEVIESSVDEDEEDNVIESATDDEKKKKKSKYNGMNVTGCTKPDGTVVMASLIKQNLVDFHNHMKEQNITGKPKEQLDAIMKELKDLLGVDAKLVSEMTKASKDNLTIDFSKVPDANMKYVITLAFTDKGVQVSASGIKQYDEGGESNDKMVEFTLDCLRKVAKKIAGL